MPTPSRQPGGLFGGWQEMRRADGTTGYRQVHHAQPDPVALDRGAETPATLLFAGKSTRDIACPPIPRSRPVGTIGEKEAALRDPAGAFVANQVRYLALDAANKAYPDMKGIDDQKDAFRHFYWVSGMTRLLGPERALAFANAHEAMWPTRNQTGQRQRDMDTFNNHVAVALTTDPRYKKRTTEELARSAIGAGCLDIIKK